MLPKNRGGLSNDQLKRVVFPSRDPRAAIRRQAQIELGRTSEGELSDVDTD